MSSSSKSRVWIWASDHIPLIRSLSVSTHGGKSGHLDTKLLFQVAQVCICSVQLGTGLFGHGHTFAALVLSSLSTWVEETTLFIVIFLEQALALLKLLLSLNDGVKQLVILRGHDVSFNGREGMT